MPKHDVIPDLDERAEAPAVYDAADVSALALRNPQVPVTLDQLAALRGQAKEVMDARLLILQTARSYAVKMTYPEDWNLYRDREQRTVCYLSDAGCERVRDILSIEIYNVSKPEKILSSDGASFVYIQTASGRSHLTRQTVEDMEGGRSSTDDFCKDVQGAQLELLVRKACRANLDGNIARELMGMKSVPLDELVEAWKGTSKDWNHARKARGFGTQAERLGATKTGVPDVEPPTCTVCKTPKGDPLPLVYRQGKDGRPSFYGCKNYSQHPQQKVTVDADQWVKTQEKNARELQQDARAQAEENKRLDAEVARQERKDA